MATKTGTRPPPSGKQTSGRSSHDKSFLQELWDWIKSWFTADGREERGKTGTCMACGMTMPPENLGMHMQNYHSGRRSRGGQREPNGKRKRSRRGKDDSDRKTKNQKWKEAWREVGASNVGDEIASAASTWASSEPETFAQLRAEMAGMDEAMRALADAFRKKQEQLAEKEIAPECLEPLGEAAEKISTIGEHLTECVERIQKRYTFFTDDAK